MKVRFSFVAMVLVLLLSTIAYAKIAYVGEPVTLTGAGDWVWTFGDGATGAGASVDHIYGRAGTYSVRAFGMTSMCPSHTETIIVCNIPSPTQMPGGSNPAFDSSGIPIDSTGRYNPAAVGRYASALYRAYRIKGTNSYLPKIEMLCDWLVSHANESGGIARWDYDFDYEPFGMAAPWAGGLANAWCSSALLGASYVIAEKRDLYFDLAAKGMRFIFTPLKKGGALGSLPDGSVWYEEYPNPDIPPHILNGMMFIMEVIDQFRCSIPDEIYKVHWNKGVEAIAANIAGFDKGYGSTYDLHYRSDKLGHGYQQVHYYQLMWMYVRTGRQAFLDMARHMYDCEKQSQYSNVKSEVLNEGIYWYRSVVKKIPFVVDTTINKPRTIKSINFFVGSDKSLPARITIYMHGRNGGWNKVPDDCIQQSSSDGYYETGSYKTWVRCFKVMNQPPTNTIRIQIDEIRSGKDATIREIGVDADRADEFGELMKSYFVGHGWSVENRAWY